MPRSHSGSRIPRQPYPSFSLVVYCAFLPPPEPDFGPVTVSEDIPVVQAWDGEHELMQTVDYRGYVEDLPRVTFALPDPDVMPQRVRSFIDSREATNIVQSRRHKHESGGIKSMIRTRISLLARRLGARFKHVQI